MDHRDILQFFNVLVLNQEIFFRYKEIILYEQVMFSM